MRLLSKDDIETLRDLARALPGICRDHQAGSPACEDCTALAAKANAILDKVEGKDVSSSTQGQQVQS